MILEADRCRESMCIRDPALGAEADVLRPRSAGNLRVAPSSPIGRRTAAIVGSIWCW